MVAATRTYFFYYTAVPDTTANGTLVAVAYDDSHIRYKPMGNFVDRGDLAYTGQLGDWWEYDFANGVRLTHQAGFDGAGVNVYVDGQLQNSAPLFLISGQVYFETHPNTATTKTVRVELADQSQQHFLLQTGLDTWI